MTLSCPVRSRPFLSALRVLTGVLLLAPLGLRGGEPSAPKPPDLPKPAATKADEPLAKKLSLARSAEFLDQVAVQWVRSHNCASCHTSYPFLMARPLLGDAKAPALVWFRQYLEARVAGWDRGKKGAGLPEEEDEAVTEIVATAATLAFDDARTGKLHPLTRQALDRMWTVQRKDGSWDWNKHRLPPQELDEYYGVVYAALGVGCAPDGYAGSEAAKVGVSRLKQYLKENRPPNLHHKTWLLWAALKLDGLMTADEREQTVQSLLRLQRKDGGWSLPALGDWKRLDGTPNDPDAPSDGYATGLVVYVLRQSGMDAEKAPLRQGVSWLKANQRASGRWYTRSLNADRAHYTTNAGTAFAVMALRACGVSDE
jgi:squalene-hopene/tetraprenyl-beta-curcumene cyclase